MRFLLRDKKGQPIKTVAWNRAGDIFPTVSALCDPNPHRFSDALNELFGGFSQGRLKRVSLGKGCTLEIDLQVGDVFGSGGCRVIRRRGRELTLIFMGETRYVREEWN